MAVYDEIAKGIFRDNPVFKMVLGICPTLAVTTSVYNGLGMGFATSFVLLCSNIIIALLKGVIPAKVRIPAFIVIISTFVTIVDLVMAGYFPDLHDALGIFIPLIVVNCIIMGRAEAFASKNSLLRSIADAVGMGIGFTIALVFIASVREVLGSGTFLNYPVMFSTFKPAVIMILAPGAFLTMGLLVALLNILMKGRDK